MVAAQRDIVVIGAGPAGSGAAREAALRGLSPLLVERDESPGVGNACGGLVASALCATLELGPGVVERRIQRTILRIDSRRVEFNSERPYFISFRRARFDAFLAERAVQVTPSPRIDPGVVRGSIRQ
ncbi:MAG: FAD-dependent oxidoreductase [Candidatus Brocadiia bacterium]|jgi:flavin-dependent dehydrogenase|nr:FAD-dependent oxidoreductase [Candidatus Brocadiia bacterium]